MALLKLGEVCKRLGVSDKTLRNWDKRDFFKPAVVSPGGKRYYTEEQVEEFLNSNKKADKQGILWQKKRVFGRTILNQKIRMKMIEQKDFIISFSL